MTHQESFDPKPKVPKSQRDFERTRGIPQLFLGLRVKCAKCHNHPLVILVWIPGGPSQLDMFDPKPHAPAEIRGEFRPIPTNLPGMQICEHLPTLAKMADNLSIIRSVIHTNADHVRRSIFGPKS